MIAIRKAPLSLRESHITSIAVIVVVVVVMAVIIIVAIIVVVVVAVRKRGGHSIPFNIAL